MDKRHREKNVCFLLTWIRDTTARVQSQDQKHYSMGVVSDYELEFVTGQETLQQGCSLRLSQRHYNKSVKSASVEQSFRLEQTLRQDCKVSK